MRFARDSSLLLQGSFCSTHKAYNIIICLLLYAYMQCYYMHMVLPYMTKPFIGIKVCEIHDFQNYKN